MILRSNKRVSEVQRIAYDVRSLILINEGRLSINQDYIVSSIDFKEFLKSDIESALNSLYEL